MRGGDHHPDVGAHRAGQHRDRGGRHRPEQHDIHADRREAADHRVLDHVARQARVLADHHPMTMVAALEQEARRLSDLHGKVGRDHAVGPAPNAVRSEIPADHRPVLLTATRAAVAMARPPGRADAEMLSCNGSQFVNTCLPERQGGNPDRRACAACTPSAHASMERRERPPA